MSAPRTVDVAPERLDGWVARFTDSHGDVTWSIDRETSPSSCLLQAADTSWARLTGWGDVVEPGRIVPPPPPALLVLLVRRGGYAVGVASSAGDLVAHKVGTRRVQSRTAAGGWSQQRYARRRANQADELVGAVAGHAVRVLGEGEQRTGPVGGLVLGGDRTLAAEALEEVCRAVAAEAGTAAGERLRGLPSRELWDLPDPRRAVLDDAVRRGRAVQVDVLNA